MDILPIVIDFFNDLKWHYKELPNKNCQVIIKYYKGKYDLVDFQNGVFKKGTKLISFKKDFKKWSYV